MEKTIIINQTERQLILYDIFRSFEKVTYEDIQFALGKAEKRTVQRDIRDLTDAGLLRVRYSKTQKAYIHIGETPDKISEETDYSNKKLQHLQRLQRLAGCMKLTDHPEPVTAYFAMFPEASERVRKRDFETLRHIGFEAGYHREYQTYAINNDLVNPYDGYGIVIENEKMVRY